MTKFLNDVRVRNVRDGWLCKYRSRAAKRIGQEIRKAISTFSAEELKTPQAWGRIRFAVLDALPSRAVNAIGADAVELVAQILKLRWAWIARELMDRFVDDVAAGMKGMTVGGFKYDIDPPGIMPLHVPSVSQANIARLQKMLRPRKPRIDEQRKRPAIARYAEWLYQKRVAGHSVNAIAKENHRRLMHVGDLRKDCECQANIRHGLKEAEELLDCCPFFFGGDGYILCLAPFVVGGRKITEINFFPPGVNYLSR
jgi:hypothetical protein